MKNQLKQTKMTEPTKKQADGNDGGAGEKPGFFKRLIEKLDESMARKAEEKAKKGSCCGGGDSKGGKCC